MPITLPPASRCTASRWPVPVPKWISGHAEVLQAGEDRAHVREHELAIVGLVEGADPRVEDLQRLRPGLDLGAQIVANDHGQQRREAMPRRRVAVHHPLGEGEARRVTSLDGVRGERERGAGEADQGNLEFAAQQANGLEDHAEILAWLETVERLDVRP